MSDHSVIPPHNPYLPYRVTSGSDQTLTPLPPAVTQHFDGLERIHQNEDPQRPINPLDYLMENPLGRPSNSSTEEQPSGATSPPPEEGAICVYCGEEAHCTVCALKDDEIKALEEDLASTRDRVTTQAGTIAALEVKLINEANREEELIAAETKLITEAKRMELLRFIMKASADELELMHERMESLMDDI